jgi:outer membrane lipoprotein SlyB
MSLAKSRASRRRSAGESSDGKATSNSRATQASLRFSASSAAFQSLARSVAPLGRTIRQNDVGRFDATLAGVVVNLAGAFVGNLAPSAIGSGSGRTATG